MIESSLAPVTAFLLGLVTAISPCTLAANISGAAFVLKTMKTPEYALFVGILLSTGRIITFFVVGAVMIAVGHTIGHIALFSQTAGTVLLGIVLLAAGVLFLEVVPLSVDIGGGVVARMMEKAHALGLAGALLVGVLFGLAFCPYSAALFFGMVVPLALASEPGGYILPVLFGLGVNVPVLAFTGMVFAGSSRAKKTMQRVGESWRLVGRVLGAFLVAASVYYLYPYVLSPSFGWLPYAVGGILLAGVGYVWVRGRRSRSGG